MKLYSIENFEKLEKKPYIKKITGTHPTYTWEGVFIKGKYLNVDSVNNPKIKTKIIEFDIEEAGVYQCNCIDGISDKYEKVFVFMDPQAVWVDDEGDEVVGFGEVILRTQVLNILKELSLNKNIDILNLNEYKE